MEWLISLQSEPWITQKENSVDEKQGQNNSSQGHATAFLDAVGKKLNSGIPASI